jgi:hypothetical protein
MDFSVSLVADIELHPALKFNFMFTVQFADLFTFDIHACPVTIPSEESPDVTTTDYKLTAEFHQNIRGHISSQINKLFDEKARQEAKESQVAQENLEQERRDWQANIEAKQAELDAVYTAWTTKSNKDHAEFDRVIEEDKAKIIGLQTELDLQSATLKRGVADAQTAICAANNKRSAQLQVNQVILRDKRAEWDSKIADAHRKLDDTTRDLHNGFGNVE